MPHAVAHEDTGIPDFDGDALPVWERVRQAVHVEGAKIFVQLWHAGLGRRPALTRNPEEPSVGPGAFLPDGHQPKPTINLYTCSSGGALAEREQKWVAFTQDEEFQRAWAETDKDGPLLRYASNEFLVPVLNKLSK